MVQMGVNPDMIMLNFLSLLAFKESNPNWFLAKALGKKACLENNLWRKHILCSLLARKGDAFN